MATSSRGVDDGKYPRTVHISEIAGGSRKLESVDGHDHNSFLGPPMAPTHGQVYFYDMTGFLRMKYVFHLVKFQSCSENQFQVCNSRSLHIILESCAHCDVMPTWLMPISLVMANKVRHTATDTSCCILIEN